MSSKKPRRGYEVVGTFKKLPDFAERPMCQSCSVTPLQAPKPKAKELLAEYLLPALIQLAILLGKRVARYLALVSAATEQALELAKRQHDELLTELQAFVASLGGPPSKDTQLRQHARERQDIVALLSAFTADGHLIATIAEIPRYSPRYRGADSDVIAQARFLYQTERVVTLRTLTSFRQSLGVSTTQSTVSALVAGRWCFDGDQWMPEEEYLTGSLWPRYDRAKAAADQGNTLAASQAARLLEAIGPVTLAAIDPDPRLPWVPTESLQGWITEFAGVECPRLERRHHWLLPTDVPLADLGQKLPKALSVVLGFLNHDNAAFRIENPPRQIDPETGSEESASDAHARARLEYEDRALSSFRTYLLRNKAAADPLVTAYNRTYRGYVEPSYREYVPPARWGRTIDLRPHQQAGAARLLAHNGGLLAFDVGVGKTLTGIAVIAKLREEGRARRPVVIVPNSILFQWLKQIQRALPDYRVLVIGAERYMTPKGVLASRTDTAQQRAEKWRQFQSGGADLVLVSYSMFARVGVRAESRAQFVWASPPMLKRFGVEIRDDMREAATPDEKRKKKPRKASRAQLEKLLGGKFKGMTAEELERAGEELAKQNERAQELHLQKLRQLLATLSSVSERERAILKDAVERWASDWEGAETDPGIYWEDLGIDCLLLDEAQNMKNLWPVPRRSGEQPPKYLGAIEEPSARALEFAIRAFLVRQRTGGSGVYLLSATPAKNSPLEYFSLLSLVDGDAWTRLGITDPDAFIDRFLKIEVMGVMDTDLKRRFREVVVGFMNLDELREIIFRYAEFRTAEEVGLKLPKVEPDTIKVPMEAHQADFHKRWIDEYRMLMKSRSGGAKNKALGILMKLSLLSIHPKLPFAPEVKDGEQRWTSTNWREVGQFSSPKIEAVAAQILSRRGCGHIVFCEPVAPAYWLREVLVEKGIPRERIAILNADEASTPLRRQAIAEAFNGTPAIFDENGRLEQEAVPPAYDVVIANSVAYEGIDLHIRTCFVHHLDLPWEPATLQQRNGRAVRQGNTQAVIGIHYYVSQGSIDVVRLQIILGKLAWMKDILKSADRETNNPAAGSELSGSDLIQFLYSPEELSELRVELIRQKEIEDRRSARKRAFGIAKRLYENVQGTKGESAIETGQQDHAVRELMRQLDEIPNSTWPWKQTFLYALLDGQTAAFLDLRYRPHSANDPPDATAAGEDLIVTAPLWERCVFTDTSPESGEGANGPRIQITVGRIASDSVPIRRFGTIEWLKVSAALLNSSSAAFFVALHRALRAAKPEDFDVGLWDKKRDAELRKQELEEALEQVPTKGIAAFGARFAPDEWRQYLWDFFGPQVLERIGDRLVPGYGALWLPASELIRLPRQQWVPWTARGFQTFIERAKDVVASGISLKWSELNQVSEAWFERPFPKGVLGKKDEAEEVQVATRTKGRIAVETPWTEGGLAVIQTVENTGWNVTHRKTGYSVMAENPFESAAAAQRYAEWLLTLPVDWTEERPSVRDNRIKTAVRSVAEWIAKRPYVPTLDEVLGYAGGLS